MLPKAVPWNLLTHVVLAFCIGQLKFQCGHRNQIPIVSINTLLNSIGEQGVIRSQYRRLFYMQCSILPEGVVRVISFHIYQLRAQILWAVRSHRNRVSTSSAVEQQVREYQTGDVPNLLLLFQELHPAVGNQITISAALPLLKLWPSDTSAFGNILDWASLTEHSCR
jgi:hypothetical protein